MGKHDIEPKNVQNLEIWRPWAVEAEHCNASTQVPEGSVDSIEW